MNSKISAGLIPALFFFALALACGLAGYFSEGSGNKQREVTPPTRPPFVRGVLQNASADHITLTTSSGPLEIRLPADATFEALRPTTFDRVSIGDWINGGAIANAQTLFALSGIIVIPNSQLATPR